MLSHDNPSTSRRHPQKRSHSNSDSSNDTYTIANKPALVLPRGRAAKMVLASPRKGRSRSEVLVACVMGSLVLAVISLCGQYALSFGVDGPTAAKTTPQLDQQQRLIPPLSDRVWKAHYLKPEDVAIGQLKQYEYAGTYQFTDSPSCSRNGSNTSKCLIHFPDENIEACAETTCMVTKTGAKGHFVPNQDRSVIIDSTTDGDWFLAALFDGHGDLGQIASHIAVSDLPSLILQKRVGQHHQLSTQDSDLVLTQAFLETDAGAMAQVKAAGTTAVAVLQEGSMVHMASAGDSTALLIQWFHGGSDQTNDKNNKISPQWLSQLRGSRSATSLRDGATNSTIEAYKIVASAVKHKPGDPVERARIEANGGNVYIPFNPKESSRVIYNLDSANGMVLQMALAMSRSLGDNDAKKLNVVIADPTIVSVDLRDHFQDDSESSINPGNNRFFVVLASDGVMDMVSLDDVILPLGRALYHPESDVKRNEGAALHSACQIVVGKAVAEWRRTTGNTYRDDISLVVKKIELR